METQKALQEYFQHQQPQALAGYGNFAGGPAWSVEHKMQLYCIAQRAFSPETPRADAESEFESLYDHLKGSWQIFRPVGASQCWTASQVFSALTSNFEKFSKMNEINLKNFIDSDCRAEFVAAVQKLESIKRGKHFPVMTVSKFLHFFNPGLVPIYDNMIIEQKVLNHFWTDYVEFCDNSQLKSTDTGAEFLGNYVMFGSSLLKDNASQFMAYFAKWLEDEIAPRKFRECSSLDLTELYATAFEFTFIGAAAVEGVFQPGSGKAVTEKELLNGVTPSICGPDLISDRKGEELI